MSIGPTSLSRDDAEHLRLLVIGHYVVAGLAALAASLPLVHVTLGVLILSGRAGPSAAPQAAPELAGWLLTVLPGALVLAGWSLAGAIALAGRSIARRRRWTFCVVVDLVAAVVCMPLGTLLGALGVVVLLRPQVKLAFGMPA